MAVSYSLGLIGYPLGHSLSPLMHTAALQASGLAGEYKLYPIPPLAEAVNELSKILGRLHQGELQGLNVTIPHKQLVLPFMDELTPAAQRIGAVNTIFCNNERLIGDNTDAAGFTADFIHWVNHEHIAYRPETALVLGAGGAARAVVYALQEAGWQVWVAARRLEQARELLVHAISLNRDAFQNLPPIGLIVNATSLGMVPFVNGNPWPEGVPFPEGSVVYDLVYNPLETSLVRMAHAQGLPAKTGLGMLVEQAALSFERWTGCIPPRNVMFSAAYQALIA